MTGAGADIATRPAGIHIALSRGLEFLWRRIEPVLVWTPALLLAVPLIFLLLGSFSLRWDSRGMSGLSLSAYAEAWSLAEGALAFSLGLAGAVTLANLLLGIPLAYVLVTWRFRGRRLLEEVVSLPVVLPPTILSMGLILGYPQLSGGWLIFFFAHLIWTLPFMVWPVMVALRAFDAHTLSQAARTLGASELANFGLVILPNLRGAGLLGSALVFILSFGEINGSLFLSSARHHPVSVALLETFMNGDIRVAAAFTIIFLLAILPPLLLAVMLRR